MIMTYPGTFTISLDFELHWGCFEHMILDNAQQQYFRNTLNAIPEMLNIFSAHEVHVTWAVVGMLYMPHRTAWINNKPKILPTFENANVSAYDWIDRHGFCGEQDPFHFAPELIDLIKSTPNQEIATHTYSHYFCLEKGQTSAQFKADLKMACQVAFEHGSVINTLIFPRNQFNHEYLSTCAEEGITAIRSSPDIWYWAPATGSGFMKKFFRAGDAYLKFQPIKMFFLKDIKTDQGLPLLLPASRLYRPWKPGQLLQNKLKMSRIFNEMTEAAQKKAYYHLWWHPHNFGNNPQECLNELERIISHYQLLNKKYSFQSLTMNEITNLLLKT